METKLLTQLSNTELLKLMYYTNTYNGQRKKKDKLIKAIINNPVRVLKEVLKYLNIPISKKVGPKKYKALTKKEILAILNKKKEDEEDVNIPVDKIDIVFNKKYKYYKAQVNNIQWNKDSIVQNIKQVVKQNKNKNTRRPLHININAVLETSGIDEEGKGKLDKRESNSTQSKSALIDNMDVITNLVDEWMETTKNTLDKRVKQSDAYINIEKIKSLNINFKWMKTSQGGSSLFIPKEYNKNIFNPTSEWNCFFDCLSKANVKLNKSISEVRDVLKKQYHSMIKTVDIKNIMKFIDEKIRISIWKVDGEGKLCSKPSKFPREGSVSRVINILLHKNHFMLIKDISQVRKMNFDLFERKVRDDETTRLPNIYKSKSYLKRNSKTFGKKIIEANFFYDMEAHTDENGNHKTYNIGVSNDVHCEMGKVSVFYGYDAQDQFIKYIEKVNEKMRIEYNTYCDEWRRLGVPEKKIQFNKKKFVANFWAHNSGRYDHYLFINKLKKIESIIHNNGIMNIRAYEFINFVDFYRHCPSSLASLCESFGVDEKYCKTEFPHDFANEKKDIYYSGKVPNVKYWPDKVIPKRFENKKLWSFKEESVKYQKLDVLALYQCFISYSKMIKDITSLSVSNFLSTPQLVYQHIEKNLEKYDVQVIQNLEIYNFIRKSIRGGRCFVQKSDFTTEHYKHFKKWNSMKQNDRLKLYNKISDSLVDFDATSLYPSAMALYKYPIGEGKVLPDSQFNRIKEEINSQTYDKHCIVKCDLEYDSTKKDMIVTPLIANTDKDGKMRYTLKDKQEIVITSVDLEEAIKYNYCKISKVHEVIEWEESEFIFRDSIKKLFNARLEAKKEGQEAKSFVLKIMMNSSYGKLIMKIIDRVCKTVTDVETFDNLIMDSKTMGWSAPNEEQIIFEIKKALKDCNANKPLHLGAFILSYSKRIMNQCIASFNGFEDWNNTFYYTDTDSMIIKLSLLEKLKKITVKYPSNEEEISLVGSGLGQLHDDLDLKNAKIIRGIWVRPKLYVLEYIGYNSKGMLQKKLHVRSKGVSSKIFKWMSDSEILERYEKMLKGESDTYNNISTFKRSWKNKESNCYKISTELTKKVINQERWSGRIYNENNHRWIPIQ